MSVTSIITYSKKMSDDGTKAEKLTRRMRMKIDTESITPRVCHGNYCKATRPLQVTGDGEEKEGEGGMGKGEGEGCALARECFFLILSLMGGRSCDLLPVTIA
jgi:hypothetical protein